MNLPDDVKAFYTALHTLARLCNFELTPEIVDLYEQHLSQNAPYGALASILATLAADRGSRDPFPSIAAIRAKLAPSVGRESQAEHITALVLRATHRRGHNWCWGKTPEQFKSELRKEVGDPGAELVRLWGGWDTLCREDTDIGILRAQLKRLAQTVLDMREKGLDPDRPAELPEESRNQLTNRRNDHDRKALPPPN